MNKELQQKVGELNALFKAIQLYKAEHPDEKLGFYATNLGSLLNAYREGDLGFDDCIGHIKAALAQSFGQVCERHGLPCGTFTENLKAPCGCGGCRQFRQITEAVAGYPALRGADIRLKALEPKLKDCEAALKAALTDDLNESTSLRARVAEVEAANIVLREYLKQTLACVNKRVFAELAADVERELERNDLGKGLLAERKLLRAELGACKEMSARVCENLCQLERHGDVMIRLSDALDAVRVALAPAGRGGKGDAE